MTTTWRDGQPEEQWTTDGYTRYNPDGSVAESRPLTQEEQQALDTTLAQETEDLARIAHRDRLGSDQAIQRLRQVRANAATYLASQRSNADRAQYLDQLAADIRDVAGWELEAARWLAGQQGAPAE